MYFCRRRHPTFDLGDLNAGLQLVEGAKVMLLVSGGPTLGQAEAEKLASQKAESAREKAGRIEAQNSRADEKQKRQSKRETSDLLQASCQYLTVPHFPKFSASRREAAKQGEILRVLYRHPSSTQQTCLTYKYQAINRQFLPWHYVEVICQFAACADSQRVALSANCSVQSNLFRISLSGTSQSQLNSPAWRIFPLDHHDLLGERVQ
jgi:hypothetical protein